MASAAEIKPNHCPCGYELLANGKCRVGHDGKIDLSINLARQGGTKCECGAWKEFGTCKICNEDLPSSCSCMPKNEWDTTGGHEKNCKSLIGHDGSRCPFCQEFKEHGKCPRGHGVLRCCCGTALVDNKCPYRHDGSRCEFCQRLKVDGHCPKKHDGRKCQYEDGKVCSRYLENGMCPRGHDGNKCNWCGALREHGECPSRHDGQHCEQCKGFLESGKCSHCYDEDGVPTSRGRWLASNRIRESAQSE